MLWAAIRGVVRLFFTLVALGVGVLLAYFCYLKLPELSSNLETPFTPRTIVYASIFVGVVSFVAARMMIGKLLRPLAFVNGKPRGRGFIGALLGFVPAVAFIWVIVIALRTTGVVEQFQYMDEAVRSGEGEEKILAPWLARARKALESDVVASWLCKLDPFVQRGKESLSKLLISTQDGAAADELAASEATGSLLQNPKIRELLDDPEIVRLLSRGEHLALLQNEKVREAARSEKVKDALKKLEIEKAVENALYSEPADGAEPARRKPHRLRRGDLHR